MEDLSLHVLDIVENSITAGAKRVEIKINEDIAGDLLIIRIKDDGRGMPEEMVKEAVNPFFTTRTTRKVGLGLSLLTQAVNESRGTFEIRSIQGAGTKITATFQYSHIDRKPLGDMAQTMITLIAGNPEVDFLYRHKKGSRRYSLDTAKIKADLEGVPINDLTVIKAIQTDLEEDIR
ncbi:MAG: ATP-binding protein [Nitrospirota bacterium]